MKQRFPADDKRGKTRPIGAGRWLLAGSLGAFSSIILSAVFPMLALPAVVFPAIDFSAITISAAPLEQILERVSVSVRRLGERWDNSRLDRGAFVLLPEQSDFLLPREAVHVVGLEALSIEVPLVEDPSIGSRVSGAGRGMQVKDNPPIKNNPPTRPTRPALPTEQMVILAQSLLPPRGGVIEDNRAVPLPAVSSSATALETKVAQIEVAQIEVARIRMAQDHSITPAGEPGLAPLLSSGRTRDQLGIQIAQLGASDVTAAQDSVTGRARPDFQPQGIDLDQILLPSEGWDFGLVPSSWREMIGTFKILPKLDVKREWEDNVFRIEHDIKSDRILKLITTLDLQSDWVRHEVKVHGDFNLGIHDRFDKENYKDFGLNGSGTYDITGDLKSTLTLSHLRGHEQRGAPDDPGVTGSSPIFFQTFGQIVTEFDNDSLLIRNTLKSEKKNFKDTNTSNNDDRDLYEHSGILRVGYKFWPGTTLFVEPKVYLRNYLDEVDDDGLRRDNVGYNIQAGVTYDLSGVSFLELGAGYLKQEFNDDDQLDTVQGVAFSGKLIWNVTDLITLTSSLDRRVNETTQVGVSSILASIGKFRVDYEIFENLLAKLDTTAKKENYEGTQREDSTYTISAGLRYMIQQYIVIDGTYDFTKRASNNNPDSDYINNLYTINARFQM